MTQVVFKGKSHLTNIEKSLLGLSSDSEHLRYLLFELNCVQSLP